MPLARLHIWNPGDLLKSADLNGEFNNILNNPASLISPLGPLTAPITISNASSASGSANPFLALAWTAHSTLKVYAQVSTNLSSTSADTFTIDGGAAGLQLHLIQQVGGQRVAIWDPSNALPIVPHTSIAPTFAAYGDILVGDIVALSTNPMTYFIRSTAVPPAAVTQLFSNKAGNLDANGGATIVYAPSAATTADDGYIQFNAFGQGTGPGSNEIQFRRRTAANTVSDSWAISGASTNPTFYPKNTNGTVDIATAGNQIQNIYIGGAAVVAATPLSRYRINFCAADAVAAGATRYIGPWATDAAEASVFVQHLVPTAGILRRLYVKATVAPGVGQTFVYTIRVNGVASTMTVTLSGAAATTGNDIVNTAAVAAGDYVTLQIIASAGAAATNHTAAVEVR